MDCAVVPEKEKIGRSGTEVVFMKKIKAVAEMEQQPFLFCIVYVLSIPVHYGTDDASD